jgi:putative oxidoreductase
MFSQMGIPAPALSAWLVIFAEFFCGIAVLLGLFTRLAAIPIAIDMLGAIIFVHAKHGLFVQNGGFEYPLTMLVASLALVIGGPGLYAIDGLIFGERDSGAPTEIRRVA